MVWVKICGITNPVDALTAVESGADALGFVFAPSPRRVGPDTVRTIIAHLPPDIEKIGVFVNEELSLVAEIIRDCGLTGVQLHGEETPQYCRALAEAIAIRQHGAERRSRLRLIKALRIKNGNGANGDMAGNYSSSDIIRAGAAAYAGLPGLDSVLFDTYVPGLYGGTGKPFAWELAAGFAGPGLAVILSGGLTPENVAEAVRKGTPFGVDVSSGVEKEPGKKDWDKLKAFIDRAKSEQAQR